MNDYGVVQTTMLIARASSECKSYKSGPFRPGGASWYFLMGEADRSRIKNSGGLR